MLRSKIKVESMTNLTMKSLVRLATVVNNSAVNKFTSVGR
jgi:hypothetical protein